MINIVQLKYKYIVFVVHKNSKNNKIEEIINFQKQFFGKMRRTCRFVTNVIRC